MAIDLYFFLSLTAYLNIIICWVRDIHSSTANALESMHLHF